MKVFSRFSMIVFAAAFIFNFFSSQALAAYSPYDLAIPVETQRYKFSIALIRQDNTMKLLPMTGEIKSAVLSPNGQTIAYVIRDKDKLIVNTCNTDGKGVKVIETYQSDRRNIQDFVDLQFVKNGSVLIIAKFIKNELAFVEHTVAKNRSRFLNKTEWKGMPFSIHKLDHSSNGLLVFEMINHSGGSTAQQIFTTSPYTPGMTKFLEVQAPPSIVDMVPDMNRSRIFAIGTQTRNPTVKNSKLSLMIINSSKSDPVKLTDDAVFYNLTVSRDGNSVVWRSSAIGGDVQFKRYNVKTKQITQIPAATETAAGSTTGVAPGVATPGAKPKTGK